MRLLACSRTWLRQLSETTPPSISDLTLRPGHKNAKNFFQIPVEHLYISKCECLYAIDAI